MWGLNGVEKVEIDNGYKFNGLEIRLEIVRLLGKIIGENYLFINYFKFV